MSRALLTSGVCVCVCMDVNVCACGCECGHVSPLLFLLVHVFNLKKGVVPRIELDYLLT